MAKIEAIQKEGDPVVNMTMGMTDEIKKMIEGMCLFSGVTKVCVC